jgi:outer membrane receptor protein involved in Fe transport
MKGFDSTGAEYNLANKYLPIPQFIPENEFTLSLAYDQDFDNFTLAGTVTYHWIDEMVGNDKSVATVADEIAAYGLSYADAQAFVKSHSSEAHGTVNFNLTASDFEDRYSATLWVKNVLDERAAQSGLGFIAGSNYQYANQTWTEPRTMGVTLKANF